MIFKCNNQYPRLFSFRSLNRKTCKW